MRLLIIIITVFLTVGCQKEEIPSYTGKEAISFFIGPFDLDSLVYSFAYELEVKQHDTIFLDMRLQGPVTSYPRAIKIKASEGTTATEGVDFQLPEFYLPAGSTVAQYPVVVYNTKAMNDRSLRIVLDVATSDDLVPGATGQVGQDDGRTIAINQYKILVSNILEQPSYWADIEYFFGTFSQTKFRFMIDVLQITDFSTESIGVSGLYNYPIVLREALQEYEREHGEPLTDEFEEEVTF